MSARRVVAIAATALGAVAVFAPVVSAAEPAAVFTNRLQSEGTNLCLDAPSPGGELRLVTCTSGDAQLWRWSSPAISTSLRHQRSGLCAERVSGGTVVRVRSASCASDAAQAWNVGLRQGYVVIRADGGTQCLARELSGVAMRQCADTPGQRWKAV
jgi:hypothetical protein